MLYIILFIFGLGLIFGSFLNVVIYRLHAGQSLLGRSFCTQCKGRIKGYDNIPIISYFILKGKCRMCNERISPYYPIVEATTGILFTLVFFVVEPLSDTRAIMELLSYWVFISVLIVIFFYDLKWYLILDIVTIPAIIFAFITNIYLGNPWSNLLVAGILGGGFFLLQFVVSGGRWIGGGDIRLGVLMGAILGFPMILVALMIAYFVGTIISLPLVYVGKRNMGDKIPFGTFLSFSTVVTLLYGNNILDWYLSLFL
jgi:leader peptidase (prepilin peptidase) / N-methyltransferase